MEDIRDAIAGKAAATLAGCTTLMSEDLHAGQTIGNEIRIRNPFVAAH